MDYQERVIFSFNKFFYDLVKDVNNTSQSLKERVKKNYKVKNPTTVQNIEYFDAILNESIYQKLVSMTYEEACSDDEVKKFQMLQDIDVEMLIKASSKESVMTYLYILTLLTVVYRQNDDDTGDSLFTAVMNSIRHMQKNESFESAVGDVFDDDIKSLLNNASKVFTGMKSPKEESPMPDFNTEMLENSKIGNLAKEITSEINIDDLKIEDTSNIMNLMNNNVIGNIMGKVGSKINEKIEKGELNHEELLGEALNFMKVLQKNGNGSNPLMSMMGDFMKQQSKGGKMRVDESKLRNLSTRDRLKKKHEEKYGK